LRRLPNDDEDLNEEPDPVAFDARVVIALAVLSRAKLATDSKPLRVLEGEDVLPRVTGLWLKEEESGEDDLEVNLGMNVELGYPIAERVICRWSDEI
jgi:hypothetical protein